MGGSVPPRQSPSRSSKRERCVGRADIPVAAVLFSRQDVRQEQTPTAGRNLELEAQVAFDRPIPAASRLHPSIQNPLPFCWTST